MAKLTITAMAVEKLIREGKLAETKKNKKLIPAMHAVADNLYLRVTGPGNASWLFRCQIKGKVVQIGLGSHLELKAGEAADLASEMKLAAKKGINPRMLLKKEGSFDPSANTFKFYAERFIQLREKKHQRGEKKHKSAKHMGQWTATLERYVYPHIGSKPPKDITYSESLIHNYPV